MENKKDILEKNYMPFIIKWGKLTNTLGLFLGFVPVLYLGVRYGLWPQSSAVLSGWISIAGIVGVTWVMQPIQFFPILGVAGTYMSNISGNISNMRVPCSIAAEKAAGVDVGTPEAEICANIGSAVSTVINIGILSIGVIAGAAVLSMMPSSVTDALNFLLPALMGSCLIMVGWDKPKMIVIGLIVAFTVRCVLATLIPSLSAFIDILSIFITIVIALALNKKTLKN